MLSRCDHKLGQTLFLHTYVKRTLLKFTFFLNNFFYICVDSKSILWTETNKSLQTNDTNYVEND